MAKALYRDLGNREHFRRRASPPTACPTWQAAQGTSLAKGECAGVQGKPCAIHTMHSARRVPQGLAYE